MSTTTAPPRPAAPQDRGSTVSELLELLEQEYTQSKHAALAAEHDAAEARNNARHAQEIARRYKHRTYTPVPTIPSSTKPKPSVSAPAPLSSPAPANSHAEDVLSLSLEVSELQGQLKRQQQEHEQTLKKLREELDIAKKEAQLAEEDAAMGLELAKEAHAERDYLQEQIIPSLMSELELLKQKQHVGEEDRTLTTAGAVANSIHTDDDDESASLTTYDNRTTDTTAADNETLGSTVIPEATRGVDSVTSTSPRAMVSMGRSLLLQHQHGERKSAHYYTLHLEQLSQKRQALWARLKKHDQKQAQTPNKPSPTSNNGANRGMYLTSATCDSLLRLFGKSAAKLQLPSLPPSHSVEQVASEYCRAVEQKLTSLTQECLQLEALCSYLEDNAAKRFDALTEY